MAVRRKTRLAPSPTGALHLGNARSFLINWLLARQNGWEVLLRIDDLDGPRVKRGADQQAMEDLKWLGLDWDGEPVYQSQRRSIYKEAINRLIADGIAYPCACSRSEVRVAASAPHAEDGSQRYPGTCRGRFESIDSARKQGGRDPAVRFQVPKAIVEFEDGFAGLQRFDVSAQLGDFVIAKGDGTPAYQLAVVVDDAEMGITHVLRGQEHLLNTVNHIALQAALGYSRPIYAHLPVILAPETGEKLSKRDRDRKIRQRAHEWIRSQKKSAVDLSALSTLPEARLSEWLAQDTKQLDLSEQPLVMNVVGLRETDLPEIMVNDFRKSGYLPETLNNFLALLGWNPGGDRERMTMAELVEVFRLEDVGKSNARFNREKLVAFNTEAVAASSPDRLIAAFKDYLRANPDSPLNSATDEQLTKLLQMKKGLRVFRDVDEPSRFLFMPDDQIQFAADAVEKVLRKQGGFGVVRDLQPLLAGAMEWTATALDAIVKQYAEQKTLGLGKVAQPLRVAVTGSTVSPPIFESLEFLGRDRTLARIQRCLALPA